MIMLINRYFQSFLDSILDTLLYMLHDSLSRLANVKKIETLKANGETGLVYCTVQNHPPRCHGGWATLWSVEEMLDGQCLKWTYLPMPELLTRASCGKDCKRISAESSHMSP